MCATVQIAPHRHRSLRLFRKRNALLNLNCRTDVLFSRETYCRVCPFYKAKHNHCTRYLPTTETWFVIAFMYQLSIFFLLHALLCILIFIFPVLLSVHLVDRGIKSNAQSKTSAPFRQGFNYPFSPFPLSLSTCSFPQKIDRPAQIYSTHHHHPGNGILASGASSSNASSLCGGSTGGSSGAVVTASGGYVYLPQTTVSPAQTQHQHHQHYVSPQQLAYHHHHHQPNNSYHHQLVGGHQTITTPTLHKKGSIRNNGEVLKRTRVQNA